LKLINADCLIAMDDLIAEGVVIDMVLCDLPYGATKNKWDSIIDIESLWVRWKQLLKPKGVVVLFGQDKFTAKMMLSNEKWHRYNLIWQKTTPAGFLNAKRMPLRTHEDIMVFYKELPTYNPQKTTGHQRKISKAEHKINCVFHAKAQIYFLTRSSVLRFNAFCRASLGADRLGLIPGYNISPNGVAI